MADKQPLQNYCPLCKKVNPGHAYGYCSELKCFNSECGESGHTKFNCPEVACWICGEAGHTKRDCPRRSSRPRSSPSNQNLARPRSSTPAQNLPSTSTQRPAQNPKNYAKAKNPIPRINRPAGPPPSLMSLDTSRPSPVSKSYARAVSVPSAPSVTKRPAQELDDTQTQASKLLKVFDEFKQRFGSRNEKLEELEREEAAVRQEFQAKLADIERRRKAILLEQERENKIKEAMSKAEDFFSMVRSDLLNSPPKPELPQTDPSISQAKPELSSPLSNSKETAQPVSPIPKENLIDLTTPATELNQSTEPDPKNLDWYEETLLGMSPVPEAMDICPAIVNPPAEPSSSSAPEFVKDKMD